MRYSARPREICQMKKSFKFQLTLLAAAVVGVGSAAAIAATGDTLTPSGTPLAATTTVTVPQNAIGYQVLDGMSTVIGTFTWDSTENKWAGRPTGFVNAIDPGTGLPIVGTLVRNPNTASQETVAFPTPPADPALVGGANVPTTKVGADFNGTETTTSSVLGAGATISDSTVSVTVPGVRNVTANPDPITYTYQNAANSAADQTAGLAPYNGPTTVSDTTSVPRASGSVTVKSDTPVYQTGSYTVNFNNTSLNGTLTGGSVELGGDGLSINALTGTASINTTTGVITTGAITKTATTKVTADGISTGEVEADYVYAGYVGADDVRTDSLRVYGSTYTNGIDNGGERITNVAPGVNGTDAVNLNQLNSVQSRLQKRIDDTDKNAKQGVATVAAMANIPQVDESKTFSLGAGVGGYDSEWGFAVGGSYRVAPAVVLKGSIGSSGGGEVAGGLGISSSW
jgi:hypothetical protein